KGSANASSGSNSGSAAAGAVKQFNVSSATKVADQCQSGSQSNPGPTARRNRANIIVAELQTVGAGSTAGASTGQTAGSTSGQSTPSGQTTTPGTAQPGTTNPNNTTTPGT